jgi:hypothetical protein
MHFNIRLIKKVVFKDREGTVLKVHDVGEVVKATFDAGDYFITNIGGIYKDEAVLHGKENQ